jgi:hypothetical protein
MGIEVSFILDLGTRWTGQLQALAALLPGQQPSVPIGQEFGWAPEMVWTLWKREKYLAHAGKRTPVIQAIARRYTDNLTEEKSCVPIKISDMTILVPIYVQNTI